MEDNNEHMQETDAKDESTEEYDILDEDEEEESMEYGDEKERMSVVRREPVSLSARSGAPGAVEFRRKPASVLLKRKDGSIFTPMTQNLLNQEIEQRQGIPMPTSNEEADGYNELMKAILEEKFTVVDEETGTSGIANNEKALEKLVQQKGYIIFEPKEEKKDEGEGESLSKEGVGPEDIECYEPGEFIEFTLYDLGITTATEHAVNNIDPEKLRIFPIDPHRLIQSEKETSLIYEFRHRIPSMLMGTWIKTPFMTQLIKHCPWPIVEFSTNLLRLYNVVLDLLIAGRKYRIDLAYISMEYFKAMNEKHNLIERYEKEGFFHYSHYEGVGHGNSGYWKSFDDPFQACDIDNDDKTQLNVKALLKSAYSVWAENMLMGEDWIMNAFPTPDKGSDIMFEWWYRTYLVTFINRPGNETRTKNILATKRKTIDFAHAQRLANLMVKSAHMNKEKLRQMVLSWIYYELQYSLRYVELKFENTFRTLQNMVVNRCSDNPDSAERPWEFLPIGDERALMQELFRSNTNTVIECLQLYEKYFFCRSGQTPDIYPGKISFLMTPKIDLTEMHIVENEDCPDVIINDAILKDYVTKPDRVKATIYWYRDAVCREAMVSAKPLDGKFVLEEDLETYYTTEHVAAGILENDATEFRVFNYEKIHEGLEHNDELLFPTEEFESDGRKHINYKIAWSPSMFLMRSHWRYMSWYLGTSPEIIEKICDDVVGPELDGLPDLIRPNRAIGVDAAKKLAAMLQTKKNNRKRKPSKKSSLNQKQHRRRTRRKVYVARKARRNR